jgi:hypothetical protein
MNIVFRGNGVEIFRAGYKRIYTEAGVIGEALKILKKEAKPGERWSRFYPDRHGLTSCRIGMIEKKSGRVYWHERYALESACKEYNNGRVFLALAD